MFSFNFSFSFLYWSKREGGLIQVEMTAPSVFLASERLGCSRSCCIVRKCRVVRTLMTSLSPTTSIPRVWFRSQSQSHLRSTSPVLSILFCFSLGRLRVIIVCMYKDTPRFIFPFFICWGYLFFLGRISVLIWCRFNPFTAVLSSLEKLPTEVPNLKSIRLYPLFAWAR